MWRSSISLYTTEDFINIIHLGYTKFIEKRKIKLNTRESDIIKRHGKHEMYEAATGITQNTVLQWTFFVRRIY